MVQEMLVGVVAVQYGFGQLEQGNMAVRASLPMSAPSAGSVVWLCG